MGTLLLLVLSHDAYFYWTHRLLHCRPFRRIHRIHHLSTHPNPFTALSFHPLEALIQALYFPVIALLLPVWIPLFLLFVYYGFFLMNIVGHSGYGFSPRLAASWLGRISNTPENHAAHHRNGKVNYGLYTLFWDWLMKTLHLPRKVTQK